MGTILGHWSPLATQTFSFWGSLSSLILRTSSNYNLAAEVFLDFIVSLDHLILERICELTSNIFLKWKLEEDLSVGIPSRHSSLCSLPVVHYSFMARVRVHNTTLIPWDMSCHHLSGVTLDCLSCPPYSDILSMIMGKSLSPPLLRLTVLCEPWPTSQGPLVSLLTLERQGEDCPG